MKPKTAYFYRDKPLFGLDIGFSSIKAMQVIRQDKRESVCAYGSIQFPPETIKDGVIVGYEELAKSIHELVGQKIIGKLTTKRVAVSIPAARTYTRSMTLPLLSPKDLDEAVRTEAAQYIPVPLEELYLDYVVSNRSDADLDLLVVAVPRKIIDSYANLLKILDLEPVAFESTIGAASRLFVHTSGSDTPTVLIDFGSMSADITIYDKALIVTGTVPCGGDIFTKLISEKLGVTKNEANVIKAKYGLAVSKKQAEITDALKPVLEQMLKEVRRVIRYYEERFSGPERKIAQIVTMGGGANMPGFSEYMTNSLRLPVRMANPWERLDFGKLKPPNTIEKSTYVTVSGLALLDPKESAL